VRAERPDRHDRGGKLADLVVVEGDPLENPRLLLDRESIWLVVQAARPVAGAALETSDF